MVALEVRPGSRVSSIASLRYFQGPKSEGLLAEHSHGAMEWRSIAVRAMRLLADVQTLQPMFSEDVITHITECSGVVGRRREMAYRAADAFICAQPVHLFFRKYGH